MSRCGSCDLYWPERKDNFGVTCSGNCDIEECADNLQCLIFKLREIHEHQHNEMKNHERSLTMATLLEQYNSLKTDMTAKNADGTLTGEQMLVFQEVLYRICVLETCQAFCRSAPVSVDTKALTYHYQLSDGYIQLLLTERKFGQQADKDLKAVRETAASSLERIVLDCRKKFSSFAPSKPELYKKSVSAMFNTVLPAWIQYRETYIKIK